MSITLTCISTSARYITCLRLLHAFILLVDTFLALLLAFILLVDTFLALLLAFILLVDTFLLSSTAACIYTSGRYMSSTASFTVFILLLDTVHVHIVLLHEFVLLLDTCRALQQAFLQLLATDTCIAITASYYC